MAAAPPPPPRPGPASLTVQQKKIPNLGSRTAKRQSPRLVLEAQSDQTYWLREEETHMPIRPNGLYNFVRVDTNGPIHLSKIDGHPALADGASVEYAGETYFDDGSLRFWSNGSGNYMPKPDLHNQAGLPEDKFLTYEEVMRGKGRHRPDRTGAIPGPAERHAAALEASRGAAPGAKKRAGGSKSE